MQRKKLLSVCVAMALSGQTWATDTSILDITDDTRKSSKNHMSGEYSFY